MQKNKRKTGTQYETIAAEYLTKQGYRMIEQNYRCRMGEIDLIAKQGAYLVFIEVKYRTDTEHGTPMEAVNYPKQRKICKTAGYYCMKHAIPEDTLCRFDVVAIQKNRSNLQIRVVQNAFEYIE